MTTTETQRMGITLLPRTSSPSLSLIFPFNISPSPATQSFPFSCAVRKKKRKSTHGFLLSPCACQAIFITPVCLRSLSMCLLSESRTPLIRSVSVLPYGHELRTSYCLGLYVSVPTTRVRPRVCAYIRRLVIASLQLVPDCPYTVRSRGLGDFAPSDRPHVHDAARLLRMKSFASR